MVEKEGYAVGRERSRGNLIGHSYTENILINNSCNIAKMRFYCIDKLKHFNISCDVQSGASAIFRSLNNRGSSVMRLRRFLYSR